MRNSLRYFRLFFSLLMLVFVVQSGLGQVRIISSSFSMFNVSAENICNINISGGSSELTGTIEAKITNVSGNLIMKASSSTFAIKNGINNTAQLGIKINSVIFQNSALSEYVNLYHQLPSGKYNYSVLLNTSDGNSDELTEEIESESSSFLSLISPPDKDTLESFNPVLIWAHQESFSLIQQGEYFRLVVTEIKREQNAEASLNINSPIFQQNFLTRHDVLYPYDAPKLAPGSKYAWQVQKVTNGIITNKTEAWEFTLKGTGTFGKSFVEITPKVNTNPYVVQNEKLYFVFKEEYAPATRELRVSVTDAKGKKYLATAFNYVEEQKKVKKEKDNVTNYYELDLQELNLAAGYYNLVIRNQKNQEFFLKFQYNL